MDIAHWDIIRLLALDMVLHLCIVDTGKNVCCSGEKGLCFIVHMLGWKISFFTNLRLTWASLNVYFSILFRLLIEENSVAGFCKCKVLLCIARVFISIDVAEFCSLWNKNSSGACKPVWTLHILGAEHQVVSILSETKH